MTQFDLGGLCFSVTYSSFNKCITLTVRLQLARHARIFACDHVIKIIQYAPENPQLTPIFRSVSCCWNRHPFTTDETSWFTAFWRENIELHELHKPVFSWRSSDQTGVKMLQENILVGKQWSDPCSSVIKHTYYLLFPLICCIHEVMGLQIRVCHLPSSIYTL